METQSLMDIEEWKQAHVRLVCKVCGVSDKPSGAYPSCQTCMAGLEALFYKEGIRAAEGELVI